ncbi:MAG: AAA family ATPase [Succinivibrionaceae bacterium]|nr:AAA family ATPase [Succinivibrionaceae bacterium]
MLLRKDNSYIKKKSAESKRLPQRYIKHLNITNMKHCGRYPQQSFDMEFQAHLNSIIGGRGSGKSTVIESIRVVTSNIDNLKNSSLRLHASLLDFLDKTKGVMQPESEISLTYVSDNVEYELSWNYSSKKVSAKRKSNDGYEALESNDSVIKQLCPVCIYSQNQINELASNTHGILHIADQSPEINKNDWDARWAAAENKLRKLCADKRALERDLTDYLTIKNELEHVKKIITQYENTGVADIIRKYNQFDIQEKSLLESNCFNDISAKLNEVANNGPDLPDFPETIFDHDNARNEIAAIYDRYKKKFDSAKNAILNLANDFEKSGNEFQQAIKFSQWRKELEQNQNDYRNLISSQNSGTQPPDLALFNESIRRRSLLSQKFKELEHKKHRIPAIDSEIELISDSLIELRSELFSKRKNFIENIIKNNKYVRMNLIPFGNFSSAESDYRSILNIDNLSYKDEILNKDEDPCSGLLAELASCAADDRNTVLKAVENLKRRTIDIAKGNTDCGRTFAKRLKSIFEDQPECIDRLLSWWPDDLLVMKYRVSEQDDIYNDISRGSAGQKASAILAFLLGYGDCPLILDQPEDDLDNALVYDLVVRQILEIKSERQIICATHNPNIVVNGDSELVTVLEFRNGEIRVLQSGALDAPEIKGAVCAIMEGGTEAFVQRYKTIMNDKAR